jgi:shikimate dehydrogenase
MNTQKQYGLIGYPLGHSFSKKYFTEKFAKEQITNCVYEAFPIDNIALLPALIREHPTLKGLNVTIPYKQSVMDYLDELDATAKGIGAVNCIKIIDDTTNTTKIPTKKLIGYNTDAFGFRQSIKPFLESQHEKALILGTGGASKAVEYVLKEIGVECFFVSRTKQEGVSNSLSYAEVNAGVMNAFKLIVNCSPVGTFPNIDDAPAIPYEYITKEHLLYDLVYNPSQTAFMQKGKQHGATTVNGLSMLQQQAEEAWRIWQQE